MLNTKRYFAYILSLATALSLASCGDDAGESSHRRPEQEDAGRLCVDDDGCDEGQICGEEGICVDDGSASGGSEDPCDAKKCDSRTKRCIVDDGGKAICAEQSCIEPDGSLKECPTGEACSHGTCVAEKCADADCTQGRVCDPTDGECKFETAPELLVSHQGALETSEDGTAVQLQVSLNNDPAQNVTLQCQLEGTDADKEASVDCHGIVFDSSNYSQPAIIEVVGIPDHIIDADKEYSVIIKTSSDDPEFNDLSWKGDFKNKNQDTAGLVTSVQEIRTSEDGDEATFTVKLATIPSADVVVTINSSNAEYGTIKDAAADGSLQLTFTPSDWDKPQSVTVVGVEDDGIENTEPSEYEITFSLTSASDSNYNDIKVPPVKAVNLDNDKAEAFMYVVTRTACSPASSGDTTDISGNEDGEGTSGATDGDTPGAAGTDTGDDGVGSEEDAQNDTECGEDGYIETIVEAEYEENEAQPLQVITTNENGTSVTLRLTLGLKPLMPVTISVEGWDERRKIGKHEIADAEAVFSSTEIVLNEDNYKTGELLTISGKVDNKIDGNKTYYIRMRFSSSDDAYNGLDPMWLKVINENTDSARILTDYATLRGKEQVGKTRDYIDVDMKLSSIPTSETKIALTFERSDKIDAEKQEFTFSPDKWNESQRLRLWCKNNTIVDGEVTSKVTLTTSSDDVDYGRVEEAFDITCEDMNEAHIELTSPLATPFGSSYRMGHSSGVTFNVFLTAQPLHKVKLYISSSNTKGMSVSGAVNGVYTYEIEPEDYNNQTKHTITLNVASDVNEDEISYINIVSESEDPAFDNIEVSTPNYGVLCTKESCVSVMVSTSLTRFEPGKYAGKVYVSISRDPGGDLPVTLSPSPSDEFVQLFSKTLTFKSDTWSQQQSVDFTIDISKATKNKTIGSIKATTGVMGPFNNVQSKPAEFSIYKFSNQTWNYMACTHTAPPYNQEVTLLPGKYEMHVYGAQGGYNGGRGAHIWGTVDVPSMTTFYLYVGQAGGTNVNAWGCNGGAPITNECGESCGQGGGATDISLGNAAWNVNEHLCRRLLVAGGGGGGFYYSWEGAYSQPGGAGGYWNGGNGIGSCNHNGCAGGGTLTAGGQKANPGAADFSSYAYAGSWGHGGWIAGNKEARGAGGGGWYGGGGGNISSVNNSGGGGSSYAWSSSLAGYYPASCNSVKPSTEYYFTNVGGQAGVRSGHGMITIKSVE